MAERRMFTKKITDDDRFMELSASAQALYLHLSMSADDDGFCNQVSISMFKAHASVQDLQSLLEKRYIYQFENGVIVIKHWRMANALRKDRYTPTVFQEELALLGLKDNGSYTWNADGCQMVAKRLPSGCQTVADCLPQDRLGKDRIGKISIEEDMCSDSDESEPPPEPKKINYQQITDMYNNICKSFSSVKALSEARKKAIKARFNTYSLEDFKTVFEKAEASDFLKGGNDRSWAASFDWLIKDANFAKVLDGNYDNRKQPKPQAKGTKFSNFNQRDYDFEAMERMLLEGQNPEDDTSDPEFLKKAEEMQERMKAKYSKTS